MAIDLKDRFAACFIGGAAGDALGYAVEFMRLGSIRSRYGPAGITAYELRGAEAVFSDDTQMTLFTAAGLIAAAGRGYPDGVRASARVSVGKAYCDWYLTQTRPYPQKGTGTAAFLLAQPGLYSPRAPGNTCMTACAGGARGSVDAPVNNSRGCGGVMRVAPVGLFFAGSETTDLLESDRIAADAAALTHGHPLAWLPSAALAHTVRLLAENDGLSVVDAASDAISALDRAFPEPAFASSVAFLRELLERALKLAGEALPDDEAVASLGDGWIGDEALAIALYCAAKYQNDLAACLVAAVNHSGDSDSTGAIAGNILGARLGTAGIPAKFTGQLELLDLLRETARRLYDAR